MAEFKWIKIVSDIFDDEKIKLIEIEKKSDTILIIWFKILCLAAKLNRSGVLLLSDTVPYTVEMLSVAFNRNAKIVQESTDIFIKYGMLEKENGIFIIPNWSKHQNMDAIDKKNEYMKGYMKDYRAKQSELTLTQRKTNGKANVSQTDKEDIYKEELDNKEKIKDTPKPPFNDLLTLWNGLSKGKKIPPIIKLTEKRKAHIQKRFEENKEIGVQAAVEKMFQSDFLNGKNNKDWVATFDWLFESPNNFTKVLEGNYDNKASEPKKDIRSNEREI